MRNIILYIICLLCVSATYGQNIYVVSVGIRNYKYINGLKNTENDAKNIAELYKTHTENIKLLLGEQATHDNILKTLNSFFSHASKNDIVVFFFSGHGSKGGLCAYDTKSDNTLLSYSELQRVMARCKAQNKQLFIDACFAGGLRNNRRHSVVKTKINPLMSQIKGIMLFLSSRSDETSLENRWAGNGFFTQYLIKGLKGGADFNKDRIVTAKEIYTFVSSNVSVRTQKEQNPVMWGKFNDNMHILNWNPKK